jgi:hypothetical protein
MPNFREGFGLLSPFYHRRIPRIPAPTQDPFFERLVFGAAPK